MLSRFKQGPAAQLKCPTSGLSAQRMCCQPLLESQFSDQLSQIRHRIITRIVVEGARRDLAELGGKLWSAGDYQSRARGSERADQTRCFAGGCGVKERESAPGIHPSGRYQFRKSH